MVTFENVLARISGELMVGFFGKGPVLTKNKDFLIITKMNRFFETRLIFAD